MNGCQCRFSVQMPSGRRLAYTSNPWMVQVLLDRKKIAKTLFYNSLPQRCQKQMESDKQRVCVSRRRAGFKMCLWFRAGEEKIWAAMAFYGMYYAMTTPVLKAMVVQPALSDARGRALGHLYTLSAA